MQLLGEQGITVTPQLVSNVKARIGAGGGKKRGRKPGRRSNGELTVAQLEHAAEFAKQMGGVEQATAALATLERLRYAESLHNPGKPAAIHTRRKAPARVSNQRHPRRRFAPGFFGMHFAAMGLGPAELAGHTHTAPIEEPHADPDDSQLATNEWSVTQFFGGFGAIPTAAVAMRWRSKHGHASVDHGTRSS